MTTTAIPATTIPSPTQVPSSPQIHTYHCVCTKLVIATTYDLSTLSRRAAPGLDNAYVLLATAPHTHVMPLQDEQDTRIRPTMVRREDGFEKRYLVRCGRCGLVVGYQLSWSQFAGDEHGQAESEKGRRRDVLYVLPGSIVATETMMIS